MQQGYEKWTYAGNRFKIPIGMQIVTEDRKEAHCGIISEVEVNQ